MRKTASDEINTQIALIRVSEIKAGARIRELSKLWHYCDQKRERDDELGEGWQLVFDIIDEDVEDFTRWHKSVQEFQIKLPYFRDMALGKIQKKKSAEKKEAAKDLIRSILAIARQLVRHLDTNLAVHKENIATFDRLEKEIV